MGRRKSTILPRSPNSQGTFNGSFETGQDEQGNLNFIGHDDTTLVHANIKTNAASRSDRSIKDTNAAGGIDSFLTISFSEEGRDSFQNTFRSNQSNSEYEFRQQLNELDRTQEVWKAKQEEVSHDVDDIGDFYVKEVGENLSSPSRKQGGTIYEEEEEIGNESIGLLSYQSTATTDRNQLIDEKTEDIIKTDEKISYEGVAGMAIGSASLASRCKSHSVDLIVANKSDQEVQDEIFINLADGNASLASNVIESEGSELDFEYPSTDEQSVNSKGYEAFAGKILVEPSGQTLDDTYTDVENDMFFTDLKKDFEPEDTDEIIREVQKRLYDLPTNIEMSFATDRTEPSPNQQSTKFGSWNPVGSGSDAESERFHRKLWGRSRALASKTDASDGEEDVDSGYNRKRRRRKLFIMNSCLVILIIAAVVCSAFFAVEMTESRSSGPISSNEGNTNNNLNVTQPPTVIPIESIVPSSFIEANTNNDLKKTQPPTVIPIGSASSTIEDNANNYLKKTQSPTVVPIESVVPSSAIEANANKVIPIESIVSSSFIEANTNNDLKKTQPPTVIPIVSVSSTIKDNTNNNLKKTQSHTVVPIESVVPSSAIEANVNSDLKETQPPAVIPIENAALSSVIKANANNSRKKTQPPTAIIESNVNYNLKNTRQPTTSPLKNISNEIVKSPPAGSLVYETSRESSPENSPFENVKPTLGSPVGSQILSNSPSDYSVVGDSLDEDSTGEVPNPISTDSPSQHPTPESLPVKNSMEEPSIQTGTDSDSSPARMFPDNSSVSKRTQDPLLVGKFQTIYPTSKEEKFEDNPTVEGSPNKTPMEGPSSQTRTDSNLSPAVGNYPVEDRTYEPTVENFQTMPPTLYSGSTKERLENISGEIIFDVSTPQYNAYDWILNKDPANLDIDSLSEEELNQRYISALFYFSLNGKDWIEQYKFLEDSHVCEWNNGSSRKKMGVICDSPGKVTGFAISKFKSSGDIQKRNNTSMYYYGASI